MKFVTATAGEEIEIRVAATPVAGYEWRLDLVGDLLEIVDNQFEGGDMPCQRVRLAARGFGRGHPDLHLRVDDRRPDGGYPHLHRQGVPVPTVRMRTCQTPRHVRQTDRRRERAEAIRVTTRVPNAAEAGAGAAAVVTTGSTSRTGDATVEARATGSGSATASGPATGS